jgi:hypothetical protein
MSFFGSLGGLISGPFNDLFGFSKDKQLNQQNLNKILGIYQNLGQQQLGMMGTAIGQGQAAKQAITQGYGNAIAKVAGAGQSAKSDVLANQTGQLAGAQQSLVSRGLGNTTTLDAAGRGIHYDTNRSLAAIDEAIGQMRAGLEVGRGQALAGAEQNIGNLWQGFNAANQKLGLSQADLLSNVKYQGGNGLAQMLQAAAGVSGAGGLGQIFGGLF